MEEDELMLDEETARACAKAAREGAARVGADHGDVYRCMLAAHEPLLFNPAPQRFLPHQLPMLAWSFACELRVPDAFPNVCGGIIADDMGLGKTVEAIGLIAGNSASADKTLVICPKNLVQQWSDAFKKFAPSLVVAKVHRARGELLPQDLERANVVIIQYNMVADTFVQGRRAANQTEAERRVLPAWVSETSWRRLVLDEAHKIHNRSAGLFKGISRLTARHRWAMSATPAQNSIDDLRSLLMFVGYPEEALRSEEDIRAILSVRLFGRTQAMLSTPLPKRNDEIVPVKMDSMTRRIIIAATDRVPKTAQKALKCMHFVRQASVCPLALLERGPESTAPDASGLPTVEEYWQHMESIGAVWETPSGKRVPVSEKVRALVEDITSHDKKCIVFVHYRGSEDAVKDALAARGVSSRLYNGVSANEMNLKHFKCDSQCVRVLIMQYKSGSLGLDMTEAKVAYFLDPDFNPYTVSQAICRIHRIGQTSDVTTKTFISHSDDPELSFESTMYEHMLKKVVQHSALTCNDPSFESRLQAIISASGGPSGGDSQAAEVMKDLIKKRRRSIQDIPSTKIKRLCLAELLNAARARDGLKPPPTVRKDLLFWLLPSAMDHPF